MKKTFFFSLSAVGAVVLSLAGEARPERHFEVLIKGARVYDGTGNPWFRADVGIRGDRIAAVGPLPAASADTVIDGEGKIVAPGFIDLHTHAGGTTLSDPRDSQRRTAPNLVAQGITTVVINSDGRSSWPIRDQREAIEATDFGPNAVLLIGHGTVRRRVLGSDFQRPSTDSEIAQMRELVRQGMAEGAYGISAGLEYSPGRWSETREVTAVVEEIVPYGGVFISHQRSEGETPMWYWPSQHEPGPPNLLSSVLETIEIGEKTGATVVASHIKAKGAHYFGSSRAAIKLIEAARRRGVSIYADQYPYTTSGSDGSLRLIPAWARDKGRELLENSDATITEAVNRLLDDDEWRDQLRGDVAHEMARRGGADNLVILVSRDESQVGRTVGELARERGVSPLDMAFILQREGNPAWRGGVRKRGFSLSEYDVEQFMKQKWTATASDAGVRTPGATGRVHARLYGTYPRKIHRYALEREVITVEHAIRSSTSLPAQILGFRDRGQVREGFYADLVVLDLNRIRDTATFEDPHQYPKGVDYVLVNGQPVVENGEITWARPGRVLTPANSSRSGGS